MLGKNDYVAPVGFAKEPRERRWLWIRRISLLIFVAFLSILLYVGVINPEDRDNPSPVPTQSFLGGGP